ncbi:DUF6503 family protein [uncultured Winogradskyella sp.]|uniref:DUF6503 family protein n=1 Tax=uncultured Winogradskyella sp. TaxID=395353 RepID=UPI0026089ABB|nr:DUF6503 family protein [uncultured Winogradskyella sp.]
MKHLFIISLLLVAFPCSAQNITAEELLQKTIAYHDPDGNWSAFDGQFTVVMTTPNSPKRISAIKINLLNKYFSVSAKRDTVTTTYTIDKDNCIMAYNGKSVDSIVASTHNMSCDRAKLYKNYYTYLYGLPMKLKDPGTNLNETIELKTFKGKEYLVLKVMYDEAVGSDVWYFYFNPTSYAMEVYQFYKTDENGNIKPESGEYILLSEETLVNGIKMPKVRAWYYNKANQYLGTDTLIEK